MYSHLYTFERVLNLTDELEKLKLENLRLKADFSRATAINDKLIEENEQLKAKLKAFETNLEAVGNGWDYWMNEAQRLQNENDQLREELADERNNHDRLQDFEVAESEELREAKLYLRILLEYLGESGYDVEKLEKIVALKRCIMKLAG